MFVDREKENRWRAAARPGIFDAMIERWRDRRFLRDLAQAAKRLVGSDKRLSFGLGRGKYLALSGLCRCQVTCARGAVWVTAVGDSRDRVLTPGQSVTYVRSGKVVITGRGETSEVRVCWD